MRRWYKLGENAVTLLELMLVLVTMAIVVAAIPLTFRSGTSIWDKGDSHAEVMQNGVIGIEDMTREIRQAEELEEVYPSNYIQFKDKSGNSVNYTDDALYLKRDSQSLAGPVESLTFTYYDQSNSVLDIQALLPDETDPDFEEIYEAVKSLIKSVKTELITYDDAERVNPIPLSSRVQIRNLVYKPSSTLDFAVFGHVYVEFNPNNDVGTSYDSNIGTNGDMFIQNHVNQYNGLVNCFGTLTQDETDVTLGPIYNDYILLPCPANFDGFSEDGPSIETNPNTTVPSATALPEYDDGFGYLIPGDYGHFDLSTGNVLRLRSGTYFFTKFEAQKELILEVKLDETAANRLPDPEGLTDHDVWFFVKGAIQIGNMLEGSITASFEGAPEWEGAAAAFMYFETHHPQDYSAPPGQPEAAPAFTMGANAEFYGTVYATQGDIDVTDGTIYGSLYTKGSILIHGGQDPGASVTTINYVKSNYAKRYWIYECE